MTEAQFGHHPNPLTDAQVEIDRLEGALASAHAGLLRALDFRAGTPEAHDIKANVRWALRESGFQGNFGERGTF